MSSSTTKKSSKSASATSKGNDSTATDMTVLQAVVGVAILNCLYLAAREAYRIRLYAIEEYGRVIHEFDPYFNYRATEYLYEHGWHAFSHWFDYMVWYPLGRPVGTTIYPGMQVTSVFIKNHILPDMSINDICCFVPAWFGVAATLSVAFLTYECTQQHAGMTVATDTTAASVLAAAASSASEDDKNKKSHKKKNAAAAADTARTTAAAATMEKPYFESIFNTVPIVKHVYRGLVRPAAHFLLGSVVGHATKSTWGFHPHAPEPAWLTPACAAAASAAIMAVVPAHLSRSIAGGYDNESIAMTAMVLTFACWCRSLRDGCRAAATAAWGVATGLCYFYMVAAWGGYVFVLNVIGVHASALVLLGRYSRKLHAAYTAYYVVGTFLATRVPVVGLTPIKSLEQLGPAAAFVGVQLIEFCERRRRRREAATGYRMTAAEMWKMRFQVFAAAAAAAAVVVALLAPTGYFGPISSRVRGLFVKHTKTGNPLVDSVAEHQPASSQAYFQYLNVVCYIAPVGFALTAAAFFNDSSSFLLTYGLAAYFFSHKMVRLILLTAPIASSLAGIAVGRAAAWGLQAILTSPATADGGADDNKRDGGKDKKKEEDDSTAEDADDVAAADAAAADATSSNGNKKSDDAAATAAAAAAKKRSSKKDAKKSKKGGGGGGSQVNKSSSLSSSSSSFFDVGVPVHKDNLVARVIRALAVGYVFYRAKPVWDDFYQLSHQMAHAISHPTIIQKGRLKSGEEVVVDDYRQAYFWLKHNTEPDARIMAWWDYGYQITGIGNRTTIADGNTWNHEHIALLGRTLTAPEREAHRIARHLADYVLVWAGGGGDDLAKSPHLRRIANSVYRGLCEEPTCRDYGFYSDGTPTENMQDSLLFKLHGSMMRPGVEADRNRFKEVYRSKFAKVRIYKILKVSRESKEWVADPANRRCDAPGSWFCPGQYPPALEKILSEKKDFKQLEDFNVRREDDSDYQKQYFENLNAPGGAGAGAASKKRKPRRSGSSSSSSGSPFGDPDMTPEQAMEKMNQRWENNEITTKFWEMISSNDVESLYEIVQENPLLAHVRSEDGRGPMWWAYEYDRDSIITILKAAGVKDTLQDANGVSPKDLKRKQK